MANRVVTIKVSQKQFNEIKESYAPYITKTNTGEYVDFIAEKNNIVVTGFLSSKAIKSITFVGENPEEEAIKFSDEIILPKEKQALPKEWVNVDTQIGSDEVGVGDYLLPMIVVASYVNKNQIDRLKELGVTDSKKLTDERIKEIGPILTKEFEFSKLTIKNSKYNEMISKGENINSLKAKMHNRALANLLSKHDKVNNIFLDQFCAPNTYYSYLNKKDEPIVRNITFRTKGESYYPSVAVSSVIARYAFLLEKEKLDAKYKLDFPFGASNKVDEFAQKLKEKLSQEEFDSLVKINFKNYKK